jgi:hypothetical protein
MGSAPDLLQNPERLAAPAETHLRIHAAKFQFTRDGMVFHAAFPIPIATKRSRPTMLSAPA